MYCTHWNIRHFRLFPVDEKNSTRLQQDRKLQTSAAPPPSCIIRHLQTSAQFLTITLSTKSRSHQNIVNSVSTLANIKPIDKRVFRSDLIRAFDYSTRCSTARVCCARPGSDIRPLNARAPEVDVGVSQPEVAAPQINLEQQLPPETVRSDSDQVTESEPRAACQRRNMHLLWTRVFTSLDLSV